jgi:uncharacterized protein (TIGR01319 family)
VNPDGRRLVDGKQRALLFDLGSTFTKARLVDLRSGALLAASWAPSTVATDVTEGLISCLDQMPGGRIPGGFDDCLKLACSSAAGGLRIVAIGLVRDLTAEAAVRASLGAGAKVVATYAGGLTRGDMAAVTAVRPDLIVLSGGTDGGNRTCIEENADVLAASAMNVPVVVAGNRNARDAVVAKLSAAGKRVFAADNVLPDLHTINTTGCGEVIRQAYMKQIVRAKGLERVQNYVGRIVMPTPHAVLEACRLVAEGTTETRGLGELLCVDIGGATTDVYSISKGLPSDKNVLRGLPEPLAKRTVEGDLGLRVNAPTIVELVGSNKLGQLMHAEGFDAESAAALVAADTGRLPESDEMMRFDVALASVAAATAVRRHAGTVEQAYGPSGPYFIQTGKDLRATNTMLATGGIFRPHQHDFIGEILRGTFYDESQPNHLTPRAPRCMVDTKYVMYAVGLLATVAPEAAARLARESLQETKVAGYVPKTTG